MHKYLDWQAANFGACIGKNTHRRDEKLFVLLNHFHTAISYQVSIDYDFRRLDETAYRGPMAELYDNTHKEWSIE